jgi:hypothetical protein
MDRISAAIVAVCRRHVPVLVDAGSRPLRMVLMRAQPILVLALLVAGCGPPPLAHTLPSSEAVAREVLSALERRDVARLRALALSEEEFERRVWPGLPAARPERNLPWSYVWMDLRQKSDAALTRTLQEHGGKHYELQEVRFAGAATDHGTYRVHRDTVLLVRDGSAQVLELRLFGSTIEADGGFKAFSYLVDQ